jgi:hypothetical protein
MNDCSAKSKLPAPLIYLSKTGNYRSIKEPDLLRAEAIGALGDLVALLARSRSLEINELREEYDELWHHLSRVRKRYSLII